MLLGARAVPQRFLFGTNSRPLRNKALRVPKPRPKMQQMKIGYARVSTEDQRVDLQKQALQRAGCRKIYEDQVSGAVSQRPGLEDALAALKSGDVLIVWKLDRLGRSLPHLIEIIRQVGEKKAGFRSLSESIDTTTAGGRLVFHLMGSLAEFERVLIAERTRAGLAAAKRRGARLGRRPALSPSQLKHARLLLDRGESATGVARTLKVGRSTLYRALGSQLPRL